MAQRIKGITIELMADNSKLAEALKQTKTQLVETSRELKQVDKLLKLDPSNVTLLGQKQELLRKQIEQTSERLVHLKELQQQFGDTAKLTEEQKEKYRLLEREIAQCENQLKGYYNEQEDVNKAVDNVNKGQPFEELSQDIDNTGKSAIKVGDIIKANLISEVIISGVKKLGTAIKNTASSFNEWSKKAQALEEQEAKVARVMKNTTNATDDEIDAMIKLTAQQEKLGVVSQETQLAGLQELGTYVEHKESLEKLLPVMNDMIAQQYGVGASMESASGIATMMGKVLGNGQVDALSRLGYKFDEAQKKVLKFGTEEEKVEMLTKIITQSVGGMNSALAQTDAGKMAIAQATFEDFQKTAGKAFSDFKAKVVGTFLPQITKIGNSLNDILIGKTSIANGMKTIVKAITDGLQTIRQKLPDLLRTGTEIIQSILKGIQEGLPEIATGIVDIVTQIASFIIDNLPIIIDTTIQVVLEVAKALGEQLPVLIPKLVEGLLNMVEVILDNIDLFIDASIQIVMGLAEGLIDALPTLIDKIPVIIDKLIDAIINNLPKIIKMGMELNIKLAEGLIKAIPELVKKIPQIISSIVGGLLEGLEDIFDVGVELIGELWEGIKSTFQTLWQNLKDFGNWVLEGIKDGLGLKSENSSLIKKIGEQTGTEYVEGVGFVKKDASQAGTDLVKGVNTGIQNKSAQSSAFKSLWNFGKSLLSQLKSSLNEHSPSKATAEMGIYLDEGLINGIKAKQKDVEKASTSLGNSVLNGISGSMNVNGVVSDYESAMNGLSRGVEASLNPTINPVANSNPLYITIDKFYNNRETDVRQLAEELEYYRKNSALAKGGV